MTDLEATELFAKSRDESLAPAPQLSREEYEESLKERGKKVALYEHNVKVSLLLAKFIKRNKNLMHLDLSSTQMTELMLWNVGSSLSRAPSL